MLDWEIYREIYRMSPDIDWGLYPHPPLDAISKKLGVARNTVWERTRSWVKNGFSHGYDVFPNPRLFGVGVEVLATEVPDARARRNLLEELEFIDGVFQAQCEVQPLMNVFTVADAPESRARREKLLLRIDGVQSVHWRYTAKLPGCPETLTRQDWKIIDAVRRQPTAPMERIAQAVGMSSKTVARSFKRLKESRAVLSYWIEDFRKFPGTVADLKVDLDREQDRDRVAAEILERFPDAYHLPVLPSPNEPPRLYVSIAVFGVSAAAIDQVGQEAATVKGVKHVEPYFRGWVRSYRHWFDERLFEVLHGQGPALKG